MTNLEALAATAAFHWPEITGCPVAVMQRENAVFRVETRRGPHALRLHRPGYHSEAALQSELDWMAMLAQGGMPVPRPAPARNGRLVVTLGDAEPRRASLLSWLDGAQMGASGTPLALTGRARTDLFRDLGRQMARMHLLADGWTPPADFTRPVWDVDGLLGDTPVWGPFWTIAAAPGDLDALQHARIRARADLTAYRDAGGDFGLIHADLVRENVLVADTALRFIDFDDCGRGFRLFEIATTLLKNLDEPDAPRLQTALLGGYSDLRPLRPMDLSILPVFLLVRSLSYLGWAQARPHDPGMAARLARFLVTARRLMATTWA